MRRLWWADFVARGQRQAGCLELGSVGRLHAAVSRLIHKTRGRYRAIYLPAQKNGAGGECTLQSLDLCAKCLVPAMTCGEVLSNNFFSRIRQLRRISHNFPWCTCSWQLNTSLSTPFAGYQGCDLYLGLSHPLTVLNRMSHSGNPTLLQNDRYQEIEEEDWVKCLHRAHSSSASAGRKLIQYR